MNVSFLIWSLFHSLGETVARKIRDGKPGLKAKVRYGAEAQQTNGSRLR